MGAPMAVASRVISTLPNRALARPPSAAPGGGVISTKMAGLRALTPLIRVVPRIQARKPRPSTAAALPKISAMPFLIRRLR